MALTNDGPGWQEPAYSNNMLDDRRPASGGGSRQEKLNRLRQMEMEKKRQRAQGGGSNQSPMSFSTPKKSTDGSTSFFQGGDVLGGGGGSGSYGARNGGGGQSGPPQYTNLFVKEEDTGRSIAQSPQQPSPAENSRRQMSATERELANRGMATTYNPNPSIPPEPRIDISDLRSFVYRPAPKGVTIQCQIVRDKAGSSKFYPKYSLSLEQPKTFLIAARKRKKSKSSNYLMSMDATDLSRDGENYCAKLRSNFVGTEFITYDDGEAPDKVVAGKQVRQELCAVCYDSNILGFKGPRKMTVLIPAIKKNGKMAEWRPTSDDQSLLGRYKAVDYRDMLRLQNKSPVWNEDTQSYVLNFNKRVTQASVKNFQIVHQDDPDYIIMQFGKVGENEFTMDYQYPMSAIQAFSIALSSFDGKLACE